MKKTKKANYKAKKTQLKEEGLILIDEIFESKRICTLLNNEGVFTVEDLIKYGNRVYNLKYIGFTGREMIHKKCKELGIELNSESKEIIHIEDSIDKKPITCEIESLEKETEEISDRLIIKRALLNRYRELLSIKKDLLTQENNIEKEIDNLGFSFNK